MTFRLDRARPVVRAATLGLFFIASASEAAAENLLFSEYVDGSGTSNRALEIYNPTNTIINGALEEIRIDIYADGSSTPTNSTIFGPTSSLVMGVHDTYVVVQLGADANLLNVADATTASFAFDGNDAIVLLRDGVIVDVIGQIGVDPGPAGWISGTVTTQDRTLRRDRPVCTGDSNASDGFDPATEWLVFPIDTFDGLGPHDSDCNATSVARTSWAHSKSVYR